MSDTDLGPEMRRCDGCGSRLQFDENADGDLRIACTCTEVELPEGWK